MLKKIKDFFIRIKPSKRKVIQLYAALLHNANMMGFVTGEIFKGNSKIVCAPGLNCYSCPGAVGACPLGTIQNALYESKTKVSTYVLGIILLYCIIFGRTVCGWLCPVGWLQELLYKIKTPKLHKNRITRILSYFKYVLLAVLVIAVPLIFSHKDIAIPGFCKYVCPAGTLGGAISLLINPANDELFQYLGPIFTWKFIVLVIFIVASIFIFRFFCRFLCPLGALYGLFNKLSILGVKVDKSKCDSCGACVRECKMDVYEVGDHECIMCGDCKDSCHVNAIHWKTIGKLVERDLLAEGYVSASPMGELQINDKRVNEIASGVALEGNDKNLNVAVEENEAKEEIKKPKFHITELHQRIFKITSYILMAALLVFTIVYANFMGKTVLNVNDNARDLVVNLYDGNEFALRKDTGSLIMYFFDEAKADELTKLNSYIDVVDASDEKGKLKLIAISSFKNKDSNLEVLNSLKLSENILLGFDDKDSTLFGSFVYLDKTDYPYTIATNNKDKIVLKQDGILSDNDFTSNILPGLTGIVVGNQVGNLCFAKDINLVGSDEVWNLTAKRGKVVVINFWYTECGPCVKELPFFDKIYKEYSDKLEVIAIHAGNLYNERECKKFIERKFKDFTITFGYDNKACDYFNYLGGKAAYPVSVIVDQEGFIRHVTGTLSEEALREKVTSLFK